MKRNSYTLEDKQRALELARKTNVRAAAYYLNIPYNTVYNWSLAATEPPTKSMDLFAPTVEIVETSDVEKREKIDEGKLIDAIRDLTSAVELLTETMLNTAERKLNVTERRA